MTCLAKKPHAAVLSSWCGFTEANHTKKYLNALEKAQEEHGTAVRGIYFQGEKVVPIAAWGPWDCTACTHQIREEARRLVPLLDLVPPDATPTMDLGCTDSGCCLRRPGGMRTNGGCSCGGRGMGMDLARLKAGASAWKKYALALEAGLVKGVK